MAGRFLGLFKVFRGKKKKSPGVSPAQQPKELDPFHPMQDGAAMDRSQEQEPARGSFHRTLKMFRKFLHIQRRNTNTTATESTAKHDSRLTELQAGPHVSPDSPECSNKSGTARNDDRAKADTAVTEDVAIPNADTRETQGIANTDTAPTATLSQELILHYFKDPCVSSQQHVPAMVKSTHQSLESHVTVDARLRTDIRRLAGEHPADVVLTLLRCAPTYDRAAAKMWRAIASSGPTVEKVLPILLCVMEDWPVHSMCTSDGDNKDIFALAATLVIWLIVPQCHKAMILYSSHLFVALLFHIVITTQQMPEEVNNFWRACQEQHRLPSKPNRFSVQAMKALLFCLQYEPEGDAPCLPFLVFWDFTPLAWAAQQGRATLGSAFPGFLVEVLECLDLTKCADSILEIMSRHVQSKCRERRCLALRGLVVLSKDPSMDNRHVQLLSLDLFCKVMELVVDEGKKPLKSTVCQSLPTLLFHCHDENQRVAEASRETLHCAAKFLKRKNLAQLVKTEKLWQFAERLVAEDRSRAAEHLRQALPYLDSPQEPLREAAIRFMGLAGRSLRGQKEELQVLSEALQALRRDDSPSQTNTGDQEIFNGRAAEPCSSSASEEPASLQDLQMSWKMRLP